MKTRKETTVFEKILRSLLLGLGADVLSCVVFLALAAVLFTTGLLPAAAGTPTALGILALSALGGGFVSARYAKERGLLYGVGTGFLFLLLTALVAITLLQEFDGKLFFVKAILTIVFGAIGGVLGVNMKRK